MRHSYIAFLILALPLLACSREQQACVQVESQCPAIASITFTQVRSAQDSIATTIPLEKGKCEWFVDLEEPVFVKMGMGASALPVMLLLKPMDRIRIANAGTDSMAIRGSTETARIQSLQELCKDFRDSAKRWRMLWECAKGERQDSIRAIYSQKYQRAKDSLRAYATEFIAHAPYSKCAVYALYAESSPGVPIFRIAEDSSLFRSILERQAEVYRNQEYLQPIRDALEKLRIARQRWVQQHDTIQPPKQE